MAWQSTTVKSPHINNPVPVIAALDVPYSRSNNGRQVLNIYVPKVPANSDLVGSPVTKLPGSSAQSRLPRWYVHIHGGAWRDPFLRAASIEGAVAHAFSDPEAAIDAVVSIDYTLSPFPTHPTLPYDPVANNHHDPSREALHPAHVNDVYSAFTFLRSLGLTDGSYIQSGHSAGSCLAFQSILEQPKYYGLVGVSAPPVPAALLGTNGLYDLPDLVHSLGESHKHLDQVYENLITIAFGGDQTKWASASPARFNLSQLESRAQAGQLPPLVVLDQSIEDQLVPVNQTERTEALLEQVKGIQVVRNHRMTGRHAAVWEEGKMLFEAVQDVLGILKGQGTDE